MNSFIGALSYCFISLIFGLVVSGLLSNSSSNIVIAFSPVNTTSSGEVNHRPVARSMSIPIKSSIPVTFVLNASDPDKNDTLTYVIAQDPDVGRIADLDRRTGEGVYAPVVSALSGEPLQGFFIFRANDSKGFLSNPAIVTFIPAK